MIGAEVAGFRVVVCFYFLGLVIMNCGGSVGKICKIFIKGIIL